MTSKSYNQDVTYLIQTIEQDWGLQLEEHQLLDAEGHLLAPTQIPLLTETQWEYLWRLWQGLRDLRPLREPT